MPTQEDVVNYFLNQGIKSEKLIFHVFANGFSFDIKDPFDIDENTNNYQISFDKVCYTLRTYLNR